MVSSTHDFVSLIKAQGLSVYGFKFKILGYCDISTRQRRLSNIAVANIAHG